MVNSNVLNFTCLVFKITKNPGPGTYAAVGSIKPDGIYVCNKHNRTKTPLIKRESDEGPKKCDRIPYLAMEAPGPGWYDLSALTIKSRVSKRHFNPSVTTSHNWGG